MEENNRLVKVIPLACPFCDEEATQRRRTMRVVTANKIYTQRECIMGHILWSVEEIPQDQSAIVDEIKAIKKARHDERVEENRLRKEAALRTDV